MMNILIQIKPQFEVLIKKSSLENTQVFVVAKPLTPEEAIGHPQRQDFPLIIGKERMIEATVLGARGHAFTDAPGNFTGTLADVLNLALTENRQRAIFVAALNATCRHLGLAEGTVHCKNEDPEECGAELATKLQREQGLIKIGLIGYNPAIADHLVRVFGTENVRVTDMNPDNVGTEKFGIPIWDATTQTEEIIRWADYLLITGTTVVNGSFETIRGWLESYHKPYSFFGVTISGIAALLGLPRMCPLGR